MRRTRQATYTSHHLCHDKDGDEGGGAVRDVGDMRKRSEMEDHAGGAASRLAVLAQRGVRAWRGARLRQALNLPALNLPALNLPALNLPALDLPLILLGALLLIGLGAVLTQAGKYGITIDEPLQEAYGRSILAWYRTLGKDTSFLTAFSPDTHMPEHGGVFDAGIVATQGALPGVDPWYLRHLLTGLCGLAGVGAIALCGYELGGPWMAFVAALGLWLYPRYSGAIYNNPKDVPAAVAMTFVLWAALVLVRQWERPDRPRRYLRNSLLVGGCIGVAASIRVNAVIWYAILVVLAVGWWIQHGKRVWRESRVRAELAKQATAGGIIGLSSLLTMMLLWPYIFLNPIVNLIHSIEVLSHYPWNGMVLYKGTEYPSTQLPIDYVPTWLVIGSPPMLALLALLGLAIACVALARGRRIDPRLALVVLAFALPLASLVALRPVLYDTLRQFLYLVPPMILLAAYGLIRAVVYLLRRPEQALRGAAVGLIVLTIFSYALVAREMVALSPFEYSYFSPAVGGLAGASGKFDTDYWAACSMPSAQWLAQNYRRYTHTSSPTVADKPGQNLIAPFLPAAFHEDDAHPDFYIAFTRDHNDQQFPTYPIIHTVAAEGVPLCVVKVNPSIVPK